MNFEDVLKQFTKINLNEKEKKIELEDSLYYTDYYKHQGLNYIKKRGNITLDDPLIDMILELDVPNIKTPLEEYNIRNKFITKNKKNILVNNIDGDT